MPELPEVETMVRGVRPHLCGRVIRNVVKCSNTCKPISLKPSFRQIHKRLVGQQVARVRRLGKRVVFDLSDGSNLVIEPRMTGLVLLTDPPDVEHLRIKWELEGSQKYDSVWFWDRRGLGTVSLFEPGELEARLAQKMLGPDALEMTISLWIDCCSQTRREIKVVLLDQKVVAGIGNLYASEILHRSAINPTVEASSLKLKDIERLGKAGE